MVPIFARPENVFTFSGPDAFIATLEAFNVPFRTWDRSEEKVTELWKEIENSDVVYMTGAQWGLPHVLVRFLLTVAFRAVIHHPEFGIFALVEYVRNGHVYQPREHVNSSESEKIKLFGDGTPAESIIKTILRCLAEENEIRLSAEQIVEQLTFDPWLKGGVYKIPGSQWIEPDYHQKIQRTPGLWNYNQIAHYIVALPAEEYFTGWRRDAATKYISRWGSTHETSQHMDPIPVDSIILE